VPDRVLFAPLGSFFFCFMGFSCLLLLNFSLSANCFPNPVCATIRLSYPSGNWGVFVSPAFLTFFDFISSCLIILFLIPKALLYGFPIS